VQDHLPDDWRRRDCVLDPFDCRVVVDIEEGATAAADDATKRSMKDSGWDLVDWAEGHQWETLDGGQRGTQLLEMGA
jgi:hypothetical protein